MRRTRRIAAGALVLAGAMDAVTALTPPFRSPLHRFIHLVAPGLPRAVTPVLAVVGVALILLARGLRRGQRHAWWTAEVLLSGSAVLHILKGTSLAQAVGTTAVAVYLLRHRDTFTAAPDRATLRRGMAAVIAVGAGVVAIASVGVALAGTGQHRLSLPYAVKAVVGRMVWWPVPLPDRRFEELLTPTLALTGLALALIAGWVAFRPVVLPQGPSRRSLQTSAHSIVARHGKGTLDYFALRDDKRHFLSGDSVVAYAVFGGVCLVSPDPVGPPEERVHAWSSFRRFADERSWTIAVLGASQEWLPIYRAGGMRSFYIGDEAVVDCTCFHLDGGRHKGLRQAVNRIARHGYTIALHDPATIEPALRQRLLEVMTKSRRGHVERGFSMTLGRLFESTDQGLLLAVASDPDGLPVAFCHYVPAPGIDGYSLDVMRRDPGPHPNGLLDFVIVETIRHLRATGCRGLGLNFAAMRSVLACDTTKTGAQQAQAWIMQRMSASMQIESLWRFTAKYDPAWLPRYAVCDGAGKALHSALAMARAESFWELPLLGRFLTPERAG